MIKVLIMIGYWALSLSCIQKAITFIPNLSGHPVTGPPILVDHSDSLSWTILWIALWGIPGILLFISPFFARRIILFSSPKNSQNITRFRLDDLGFVLYAGINVTWGLSWYLAWILDKIDGIPSTAYNSGGTLLAPGIFVFAIWAIYFNTRETRGELL